MSVVFVDECFMTAAGAVLKSWENRKSPELRFRWRKPAASFEKGAFSDVRDNFFLFMKGSWQSLYEKCLKTVSLLALFAALFLMSVCRIFNLKKINTNLNDKNLNVSLVIKFMSFLKSQEGRKITKLQSDPLMTLRQVKMMSSRPTLVSGQLTELPFTPNSLSDKCGGLKFLPVKLANFYKQAVDTRDTTSPHTSRVSYGTINML